MNPKRQIIEQAIMDLEKNREVVRQVREEREKLNPGPDYYQRAEELDAAMEKAREERVNIAVRLFRDYLDYQGNPVVGNPNEAFYDPNPTPIFSVGDFHRGPGIPRTIPAITGARTKYSSAGRSTLRRIDKFIKQLKDKMKRRKDLQENIVMKLTEAKLKILVNEVLKEAMYSSSTLINDALADPDVDFRIKNLLSSESNADKKQGIQLLTTLYPDKYGAEDKLKMGRQAYDQLVDDGMGDNVSLGGPDDIYLGSDAYSDKFENFKIGTALRGLLDDYYKRLSKIPYVRTKDRLLSIQEDQYSFRVQSRGTSKDNLHQLQQFLQILTTSGGMRTSGIRPNRGGFAIEIDKSVKYLMNLDDEL